MCCQHVSRCSHHHTHTHVHIRCTCAYGHTSSHGGEGVIKWKRRCAVWKTGGRRLQAQLVSFFLHRLIRGIAVVVPASSGSALARAFASCVASLSCLPPSASSQGVRLSSTRAFLPEHLPTPAITIGRPKAKPTLLFCPCLFVPDVLCSSPISLLCRTQHLAVCGLWYLTFFVSCPAFRPSQPVFKATTSRQHQSLSSDSSLYPNPRLGASKTPFSSHLFPTKPAAMPPRPWQRGSGSGPDSNGEALISQPLGRRFPAPIKAHIAAATSEFVGTFLFLLVRLSVSLFHLASLVQVGLRIRFV